MMKLWLTLFEVLVFSHDLPCTPVVAQPVLSVRGVDVVAVLPGGAVGVVAEIRYLEVKTSLTQCFRFIKGVCFMVEKVTLTVIQTGIGPKTGIQIVKTYQRILNLQREATLHSEILQMRETMP